MTFRRRTYPEVLDNILTGVVQGVSNESHPFPPDDGASHHLEKAPVSSIISVFGTRNGESYLFRPDQDYTLENESTMVWNLEGGDLPDAGTLIHVNYYPSNARSELTDIYPGSVLRTISETIALEISRLYAQLEAVYQSGFIDSATGSALDKVVALLNIVRVTGNHPAGELLFTRSANSRGSITIPAGTRVIIEDGSVEYETSASVTLLDGQKSARVSARDLESTNDPLPADVLTVLPLPIVGIESVTNPNPTAITTQSETDGELRARAKNFLHGSERATVGALRQGVARQGVTAEIVEDPAQPGYVTINAHAEQWTPELQQRVLAAIRDARPAGVIVNPPVPMTPRQVTLKLLLTTTTGLLPIDLRAAQESIRTAVADYFDRLPLEKNGSVNQIAGLVLAVPGVEDVRITDATWDGTPADVLDLAAGELKIGGEATVLKALHMTDPNLPSLFNVTITYPADAAIAVDDPDQSAIQSTLAQSTVPYLNSIDAETGDPAARELSFGKLLHALPLPGKTAVSLATFDAAPDPSALPTAADIAPYQVAFTIMQQSGLTQLLSADGDVYMLAPYERISLDAVALEKVEGNNA